MRAVALLSIWYGMVPADLLKHLLRELWEVGGGGQLPAKHPQCVENIKRVFISTFFRLCNPFTHLRSLNKYCESAVREGNGMRKGDASRVFNFKVNICLQGAFDIYYL